MSGERILIFSAGASIDKTYSVTAEEFKPTHVFVMVEEEVRNSAKNKNDSKANDMQNIIEAISRLENWVKYEDRREFGTIILPELTQTIIQDKVLELRKKYPDAEFMFNVTGGTALFSTTLFLMGVWLGGKVCITRTKRDPPIYLTTPKISLIKLEQKPDLKKILLILGDNYPKSMENSELMKKIGIPNVGTKYVKKSDKSNHTKRMEKLIELNLVKPEQVIADKRRIQYRLTKDGEFAYKFIAGGKETR